MTDLTNPSVIPTRRERRQAERAARETPPTPALEPRDETEREAEENDRRAAEERGQRPLGARIVERDGQYYEYTYRAHAQDILRPYITLVGSALAICAAAWAGKNLLNEDQVGLIIIAALFIAAARWVHDRT